MSTTLEKIDEMHSAISELRQTSVENAKKHDSLNEEKMAKLNDNIDLIQSKIGKKSLDSQSIVSNLSNTSENQKTIQTQSISDTGIQSTFTDLLNQYVLENSVIRQVSSVFSTSSDYFDAISYSNKISTNWSEGLSVAEESNSFIAKQIRVFDLTIQPKVTQRLLNDSEVNFKEYLAQEAGVAIINAENDVFINGTGVNQPEGILSNIGIESVSSEKVGDITADAIINMYHLLDDAMSNDAVFLMNKATVNKIRTLQDASGHYLWSASVLSGKSDTLLGMPLYTTNAMPSIASGKKSILFGNFKRGYQIIDRVLVDVKEDPYTSKPYVIYFITKGVGAAVVNPKAILSMKID